MEIFGWILLLILGLFGWIIFVPVYLNINTQRNKYNISQYGTFQFAFMPGEKPNFSVRVFGISIPTTKKPKRKPDKKKKSKPFIKRSIHSWIFLMNGLLKSFRVKRLVGTADLDDVVLHSQFYAISPFINQGPVRLTSNLNNYYFLDLIIEGRLNKMLYTFIIFLTKK